MTTPSGKNAATLTPTGRTRLWSGLSTLLVVAIAGSLVYALSRGSDSEATPLPEGNKFLAANTIVFRALGSDKGKIARVPLSDPSATRQLSGTSCLRVAASASTAVCLRMGRNPVQPYEAVVLDDDLKQVEDQVLNGVPSRARVAQDGSAFATTVFVNGHNYISLGFSTETIVYKTADANSTLNLENFEFFLNGDKNENVDRNVWGVTFSGADANRFYATVATGGRTYVVRGDIRSKKLTAIQENAECPSISPDGLRLVYKKRINPAAEQAWRFHVLELATGEERILGETRSVDDQVAWLDNSHVLYGVQRVSEGNSGADVWSAPVDGGEPVLVIRDADSPSVMR